MSLIRRGVRSSLGQKLVSGLLSHMSHAIPVQRLHETDTLLAFFHPRPTHPFHVVIVPKKSIARLEGVDRADGDFLCDLFAAVRSLASSYHLEADGFRLIVNGGKYQDFPYLHFHLISDTNPHEQQA